MKKFVSGLIVGLILATTLGTMAANNEVTAVFAKFNFVVNGEVKQLETDPLVYQGTTYLPVRVISNILGYDVTYKADTRTIELNSVQTPNKNLGGKENVNTTITFDYIELRDLKNYGVDEILYGGINGNDNMLRIVKGDSIFDIPNFTPPKNGTNAIFDVIGGGSIEVKFENGITYISLKSLQEAGIIN